jgi:hypothetical protein
MKKVHIITAEFGNPNAVGITNMVTQNTEYSISTMAYTDDNFGPDRKLALHPRLKGKIPKMLEWMITDADYYIWLDSPFEIISDTFVENTIKKLGECDICLCKHNKRSSIRDEYDFVNNRMKNGDVYLNDRYTGEALEQQINTYLSDNLFKDNTLFELGFFVYSKKLIKNKEYNLMTDWFFHNCYYSVQDQLSMPYLLHKHNTNYTTFDFNVFNNPDARYNF